MQYTYEYNGDTHTIRLDRQPDGTLLATINDREIRVHATRLANGEWLLLTDDDRQTVHVAAHDSQRYVQFNGTQYALEKVDPRRRRQSKGAAIGDLTAEMPGQVIDVRVAAGDSVQSGDVLVVLEAMKMEIRITAPHDGTVDALHVSVGDVVERGQVLVEVTANP